MKTYRSETGKYEVILPEEYNGNKVVGTVWEKNGKCRLYVKVYYNTCSPTDCGFIDMMTGKSYLSSRPVMVSRNIERETEIRIIEEEVEEVKEEIQVQEKEEEVVESTEINRVVENCRGRFPEEMYKDLGIRQIMYVKDSKEDEMILAKNTQVTNFVSSEHNFDVTFYLYKGNVFTVYGHYQDNNADIFLNYNLNELLNEFEQTYGNYERKN